MKTLFKNQEMSVDIMGNVIVHDKVIVGILPRHVVSSFADDEQLVIRWCVEDVMEASRDEYDNPTVTEDEAKEILLLVERDYDCNHGVTWETIQSCIRDMQ